MNRSPRAFLLAAALAVAPHARAQAEGPTYREKISALNAAIAGMLEELNTASSVAILTVSDAMTNASRATKVGGSAVYRLLGESPAHIEFKDVVYSYPEVEGAQPRFIGSAKAKVNFLRLIPQAYINSVAQDKSIDQEIRSIVREYGEAASVDAKICDRTVDAKGDVTGFSVTVSYHLDVARLSKEKRRSALITELEIRSTFTLDGADISVQGAMNPEAREFLSDEQGMKEDIDALISRDPKPLDQMKEFMRELREIVKASVAPRPA